MEEIKLGDKIYMEGTVLKIEDDGDGMPYGVVLENGKHRWFSDTAKKWPEKQEGDPFKPCSLDIEVGRSIRDIRGKISILRGVHRINWVSNEKLFFKVDGSSRNYLNSSAAFEIVPTKEEENGNRLYSLEEVLTIARADRNVKIRRKPWGSSLFYCFDENGDLVGTSGSLVGLNIYDIHNKDWEIVREEKKPRYRALIWDVFNRKCLVAAFGERRDELWFSTLSEAENYFIGSVNFKVLRLLTEVPEFKEGYGHE